MRKRECIKPKYPVIMKATKCIDKHQILLQKIIKNSNNKLSVIEDQMLDLDKKTTGVCCMITEVEKDIKNAFVPKCPEEASYIVTLYRTVLQDVLELICRAPKCNDVFKGYTIPKNVNNGSIIAYLVRIIFSLG